MTGNRYFNKEHLWVRVEGNKGTIGLSYHAQEELGDILLVEPSGLDTEIEQSASFGQVESAKAVSDLISPVSGTVIEVNELLEDEPELMNEDPYEKGWIIKLTLKDVKELDDLMDEDEYKRYLQEELDS
ncbi:MAG: glycine cleavage system protein GcvH [Deltaproteobacteria bacterium]|nr:glycine cleavage system protein GcvH [Deltaproteobacteria bacterium]